VIRKLKSLRPGEKRLLLAIALCVFCFVATPTSPTENGGCLSSSSRGTISIVNVSDHAVSLTFTGPEKREAVVQAEQYYQIQVKTGTYTYVGYFVYSDRKPASGTCVVKKDQTTTVTIS
jgi:hypothetical protein